MRRPSRAPTPTELKLAYAAAATLDTWLSGKGRWAHRARFVTKPALMPLLTASLLLDPKAKDSPLRTSTALAQVGGLGGDVALLASGTKPFLAGAGSFGLGHIAYVTGFLRRRDTSDPKADAQVRAIAAVWAVSAPVMAVLAARRERALGGPVLGYATLLSGMAAAASHLDPELPKDARRLTAAGATLFMVSDTLLAIGKFALEEAPPQLETAVMATYTSAQFLLSEGAARA